MFFVHCSMTSIRFVVFDKTGKKKDIKTLRFDTSDNVILDKNTGTGYTVYTSRDYDKLFDQYFIPTAFDQKFMLTHGSTFIPGWTKPKEGKSTSFVFNGYKYFYNGAFNMFSVEYVAKMEENDTEIHSFPFVSFNGLPISYKNLYKDLPIKSFDFNNLLMDCCVDIHGMFEGCIHLEEVRNFIVEHDRVKDIANLFKCCSSLHEVDMSSVILSLDTASVKHCFAFCRNLERVNIANMVLQGKFLYESSMFIGCKSLKEVIAQPYSWRKIVEHVPMKEFWTIWCERLAKLPSLTYTSIRDNDNNIANRYVNSFFIEPTVTRINGDVFIVL